MARLPGPTDISVLAHVIARCRATRPDVVHGTARRAASTRGSRHSVGRPDWVRCYTPHGGRFNYRPGTAIATLYMAAEKLLARNTDISCSRAPYRPLLRGPGRCDAGLAAHRANGIGPAETLPVEPAADAADFLYVGELRSAKGIDTLIEALAEVGRRRAAARARCSSARGRSEQELGARAGARGIADHVRFPGAMPAREAFRAGASSSCPRAPNRCPMSSSRPQAPASR